MQEYSYLIPVIIAVWVFLLTIRIGAYLDKKAEKSEFKPIPVEKICPPHKWLWEEQIGMEGTFYIRCQVCRRLPGWDSKET